MSLGVLILARASRRKPFASGRYFYLIYFVTELMFFFSAAAQDRMVFYKGYLAPWLHCMVA